MRANDVNKNPSAIVLLMLLFGCNFGGQDIEFDAAVDVADSGLRDTLSTDGQADVSDEDVLGADVVDPDDVLAPTDGEVADVIADDVPDAEEPPDVSQGVCGDGDQQPGEACDDGNTVDGDYCAADCGAVTGFCGDATQQDNEECDDGDNNGQVGSCTDDCTTIVAGCGDGVIQAELAEECDPGDLIVQGCTACEVDPGYVCDDRMPTETCDLRSLTLFATSPVVGGDLGGREGLDELCTSRSLDLALSCPTGVAAFISTRDDDEIATMPNNHGVPTAGQVTSPLGTVIADNFEDLLDGTIYTSLDNAGVTSAAIWWSGSTSDGRLFNGRHCNGWRSSATSDIGQGGFSSATDSTWMTTTAPSCESVGAVVILCLCW